MWPVRGSNLHQTQRCSEFLTRSNTNCSVQAQKMAGGLKFHTSDVEALYYLCSENKAADKLRSSSTADLHLCFCICKKLFFSWRSSNANSKDTSQPEVLVFKNLKGSFKKPREWFFSSKETSAVFLSIYQPRHEKTNCLISDLVKHKLDCTATEDG